MNSEQLTELDQDRAEVTDFSGGARAYLIVHGPERADVVEVPVDRETVIGRGADAHAVVDDARVSRRHARLRWEGGSLFIDDLGSRNGTNVNGEDLAEREPSRARRRLHSLGRSRHHGRDRVADERAGSRRERRAP